MEEPKEKTLREHIQEIAALGGKARAAQMTAEDRRKAGLARANKLSPERRSEIARQASLAYWEKRRLKDKK